MYPSKIICLTEETVETLYLLGKENLIAGVSEYVTRPIKEHSHPVVSQFIKTSFDKIDEIDPDLIIGFSDLQRDIAKELIGRGHDVWITNQRSIEEILNQIILIGRIVGEEHKALNLVDGFRTKIEEIRAQVKSKKIKVYFEEWDHPRLSCISWVSELIEICGGENIFRTHGLAKFREVSDEDIIRLNPDIILASWCGKKFDKNKLISRVGYDQINAVRNNAIYELSSDIYLQPGPALFIDGLDQLFKIFSDFLDLDVKK